jgi:hypothetical protein
VSLPSLLPLVLLLAAAVVIGTSLANRSAPSRETAVAAARRHARATSAAALVLGAAAGVGVATLGVGNNAPGGLGVTVLMVPIAFALVHTAVVAAGELTWPRPDGEVRRARLARRGPFDAAPRRLVTVAGAATALAALTLTTGALTADATGRGFTWSSGEGEGAVSATATPFPGLFYGAPTALGLLLLAGAVLAALRVVADRPAVATEDERTEAALRRASAHRVLRAATAAVLVDTGGLLSIGGMAARVHPGPVAAAGVGAAVLGGLAVLAGVAVACTRAPGLPADAPAVPIG